MQALQLYFAAQLLFLCEDVVFRAKYFSRPNIWPCLVFSELLFQSVAPNKERRKDDFFCFSESVLFVFHFNFLRFRIPVIAYFFSIWSFETDALFSADFRTKQSARSTQLIYSICFLCASCVAKRFFASSERTRTTSKKLFAAPLLLLRCDRLSERNVW